MKNSKVAIESFDLKESYLGMYNAKSANAYYSLQHWLKEAIWRILRIVKPTIFTCSKKLDCLRETFNELSTQSILRGSQYEANF